MFHLWVSGAMSRRDPYYYHHRSGDSSLARGRRTRKEEMEEDVLRSAGVFEAR